MPHRGYFLQISLKTCGFAKYLLDTEDTFGRRRVFWKTLNTDISKIWTIFLNKKKMKTDEKMRKWTNKNGKLMLAF